jgi:hypothetical protein
MKKFNLDSLRNWKRSQLELLTLFVKNKLVTQKMISEKLEDQKITDFDKKHGRELMDMVDKRDPLMKIGSGKYKGRDMKDIFRWETTEYER